MAHNVSQVYLVPDLELQTFKIIENMKDERILKQAETQALNIPVVSNCTCGKEKRYCKGCLCDVTETMYCYCGEFPLTKESTYTDADLKDMNV